MIFPKNQLSGRTFGNALMYRWLIVILKHVNIHLLYGFMGICVIPFTLIFSPGAIVAFHYFHKGKRYGWLKSWWKTYCNHVIFGKIVIDKFSIYSGHKFKINYQGLDYYTNLTNKPEPFLQLSAHIGCSEIIGYSYDNEKPGNVLVYGGENKSLMAYREMAFRKRNIRMIPIGSHESHSDDIIKALERGEIIYAFADRLFNTTRTIKVCGNDCQMMVARGPLSIAVTRGLNVIMTNAMKEPDGSYTAYFTPLCYDKTANKRDQLQQLAEAYITEIERLLGKYPLQWFNYSNQKGKLHKYSKK